MKGAEIKHDFQRQQQVPDCVSPLWKLLSSSPGLFSGQLAAAGVLSGGQSPRSPRAPKQSLSFQRGNVGDCLEPLPHMCRLFIIIIYCSGAFKSWKEAISCVSRRGTEHK